MFPLAQVYFDRDGQSRDFAAHPAGSLSVLLIEGTAARTKTFRLRAEAVVISAR